MVANLPRWLRGSNGRKESIASCPKCLTIETLWFWRNRLEPTRRFTQKSDGKVYHDCGSLLPCRLFTVLIETGGKNAVKIKEVKGATGEGNEERE